MNKQANSSQHILGGPAGPTIGRGPAIPPQGDPVAQAFGSRESFDQWLNDLTKKLTEGMKESFVKVGGKLYLPDQVTILFGGEHAVPGMEYKTRFVQDIDKHLPRMIHGYLTGVYEMMSSISLQEMTSTGLEVAGSWQILRAFQKSKRQLERYVDKLVAEPESGFTMQVVCMLFYSTFGGMINASHTAGIQGFLSEWAQEESSKTKES